MGLAGGEADVGGTHDGGDAQEFDGFVDGDGGDWGVDFEPTREGFGDITHEDGRDDSGVVERAEGRFVESEQVEVGEIIDVEHRPGIFAIAESERGSLGRDRVAQSGEGTRAATVDKAGAEDDGADIPVCCGEDGLLGGDSLAHPGSDGGVRAAFGLRRDGFVDDVGAGFAVDTGSTRV